jgi:hypothetical protein
MKLEVARPLGLLLIAVAAFIIVIPFMNVGLQVWPWRPTVRDWRFGTWGFLLGALTLPTLGLGLLAVGGLLRDSAAVLRVTLALAGVLGLVALVGLADFVMAGTALKHKVTDPKLVFLYGQELRRTTLIGILAVPALVAIAVASYRLVERSKPIQVQGTDSLFQITKG